MFWLINSIIGLFTKVTSRKPKFDFDKNLIKKITYVYTSKKDLEDLKYQDITYELLKKAVLDNTRFINDRSDCADFRCLELINFKLSLFDLLNKYPDLELLIKNALLGFKFWIKSKGKDSMCYYSENHQMIFIACEYLISMIYQDEIFLIDNKDSKYHMNEAINRFNIWCELRDKYSFSEFYSSNYLPIDLSALIVLMHYSKDNNIKFKCKKYLDKIILMYSETLFHNTFINANGRDYPRNLINSDIYESNSDIIIDTIFNGGKKAIKSCYSTSWLFAYIYLNNDTYKVSDEIINVSKEEEKTVKRKFGLSLKEYDKEGLNNLSDKSLMMQLGSGALTNPEIINNTFNMMHKYKHLYSSDFLFYLRYFESPLLRMLGLMPLTSKLMKFFTNGMSIGEANVYTYRNKYYKLSTLVKYEGNTSGAQKNTMVVTLDNGVTIFTNHPRSKSNLRKSPSYFGGYGISPYASQDKNICLMIYDIPLFRRIFQREKMYDYTHTFFPTENFSEYVIDKNYAFARINDSYIALIGKNNLFFEDNNKEIFESLDERLKDFSKPFDLIQKGRKQFYIYELSDGSRETYESFINRIKNNTYEFKNNVLVYNSERKYKLEFNKEFYIDNKIIDTNYRR